jgi:CHASE2 domain-containing sensor protein
MSVSSIVEKGKLLYKELRKKKWHYWPIVLLLLVAGTIAGEILGEQYVWIRLRYYIYPVLQAVSPGPKGERKTVLVLINDDDYWKGELARRVPLKRDYLARLVRTLNQAEPTVIALDIDLRSPIPQDGVAELPQYQQETEDLLMAIREVSQTRNVVLTSTVHREGEHYIRSPNIYDGYDFGGGKVFHGYVTLPRDIRQVPLAVELKDSAEKEESFANAIAKTRDEAVVAAAERYIERGFPYGSFYGPEDFTTLSANSVLQSDVKTLRDKMQGRIIIVGGAWHTGSYKGTEAVTEESVDLHFTPANWIPGAFVHANYVEALVCGFVHPQLPESVGIIIEVLCSLSVAIIFAREVRFRRKLGSVLILCAVLLFLTYVLWQNLGLFFDFFIPLVLLSIHAPIEQLRESRAELRHLRERVKELESKKQQPEVDAQHEASPEAH